MKMFYGLILFIFIPLTSLFCQITIESDVKEINLADTKLTKEENQKIQYLPTIEWISPIGEGAVTSEHNLTLKFRINGEKRLTDKDFRIRVNPIKGKKAREISLLVQNNQAVFTANIQLTEGLNNILIELKKGNEFIEIGRKQIHKTEIVVPTKPNLHILAIGPSLDLRYTKKDANDFLRLFKNQGGLAGNKLFETIYTYKLTGNEATAENIRKNFEQLENKTRRGEIRLQDVVIIYISSHGVMLGDDFRIVADDASTEYLKTYSISYETDMLYLLKGVKCKKIILMDACHGGGARIDPRIMHKYREKMKQITGLSAIASSKEMESSFEDAVWKNGAFTEGIINGLGYGHADKDGDKVITIIELYNYLLKVVPPMVRKVKNRKQTPSWISNELGALPFYILN